MRDRLPPERGRHNADHDWNCHTSAAGCPRHEQGSRGQSGRRAARPARRQQGDPRRRPDRSSLRPFLPHGDGPCAHGADAGVSRRDALSGARLRRGADRAAGNALGQQSQGKTRPGAARRRAAQVRFPLTVARLDGLDAHDWEVIGVATISNDYQWVEETLKMAADYIAAEGPYRVAEESVEITVLGDGEELDEDDEE
uniref:Orf462c n=1 Tax=Deinococcus radiodurans TaxID=1299 RepID=Q9WXF3_DEIRD|nr:Orf462c [Deinococcus radiodurans]